MSDWKAINMAVLGGKPLHRSSFSAPASCSWLNPRELRIRIVQRAEAKPRWCIPAPYLLYANGSTNNLGKIKKPNTGKATNWTIHPKSRKYKPNIIKRVAGATIPIIEAIVNVKYKKTCCKSIPVYTVLAISPHIQNQVLLKIYVLVL